MELVGEITIAITLLLTGGDGDYANLHAKSTNETTRLQVRNIREAISANFPAKAEYGRVKAETEATEHDGTSVNSGNNGTSDTNGVDDNVSDDGTEADEVATQIYEVQSETYVVTAYTAGAESTGKSPGEEGYGITASGAVVTEGRTVACPEELAFGTVVDIEGVGVRVCEDRGSAITSGHIDVYMPLLEDAQAFGRQSVEVEILNEGE